jgi:hypothetical protein
MLRHITAFVGTAALAVTLVTVARATSSDIAIRPTPDPTYAALRLDANSTYATAAIEWPVAVDPLASPAGADSSAPQLTAQGTRVILSWMERAGPRATLKFAERTPSGWSPARSVVSGGDLVVNAADVPSVRALAAGTVVAQWMQENGPDPEAYDLRLAWSADGGATWSKPVSPHRDGTKTQHGFASLFQAPGAGLGLIWLDGRATDPESPAATGNMSLRAAVYSRSGRQLRESAIDTRVCECCPTAVAATSEGPIVAFRNRSDKEVRDIFVSRLVGGRWTPPSAVHNDGWAIEACPVNGPAVSARGRNVAVAWFHAKDEPHTFVAFSRDAGRTFGAPARVDEESATGHVGIVLLDDGSAAVSWVEFANQRAQLKVRRIESNGGRAAAVLVAGAGDDRVAGTPRMVQGGDELVLAWTETSKGASRVQTARMRVGTP